MSDTLAGVSWTVSVLRLVGDRPWHTRFVASRSWRPRPLDVLVAAAAFAGSLLLAIHGGRIGLAHVRGHGLDAWRIALTGLATVPLVAWRSSPLLGYAVSVVASVLLAAAGTVIWPIGPATALYLVAISRDRAVPWTPRMAGCVVVLLAGYLGATVAAIGFAGSDLVHAFFACAAAWFAGDRTRLRREQMTELRRRAVLAEQDAARDRQLAVAEERARIARDLHDSAGHALNVIGVRAGAARLRHDQDPDRAPVVFAAIEDLARQTVADIDQFVGTLRADGTGLAVVESPIGLASLDTLIAQHEAAGRHVSVVRTGEPRPLGAAVDQGAYRIIQEALTNAARYGTGTATVELAFPATALEFTICNLVPEDAPAPGLGGHGVIGMRERATLLGGELTAERTGTTYRVDARLPCAGRRP
jgi:signal transduction histidine kinase